MYARYLRKNYLKSSIIVAIMMIVGCSNSNNENSSNGGGVGSGGSSNFQASSYVAFESGQVRPLALSPNSSTLYAVNTPDNTLEIFSVSANTLTHTYSVPVGLEPVSVATPNSNEVWVVNHISDSISIVDVTSSPPQVTKTLLVGDEPRDIVFAGPGGNRAFITTAHRGQNSPYSPELMPTNPGQFTTEGIGRADVWVFDVASTGTSLGGDPVTILTHFTDTPRALAVSADGSKVYAAGFHTGNQTAIVGESSVCDGGEAALSCDPGGGSAGALLAPGGIPDPDQNIETISRPEVGIIVKYNDLNGQWEDELGRDWSNQVRFDLPDKDVFVIDANATIPVELTSYSGVGTILFNMAVNPVSEKIYVSNTEARNEVRFEGTRETTSNTTVVGHLHEAQITVLDGTTVTPIRINKHIDYSVNPALPGTKEKSLAMPMGMEVSADGKTLYVAAFGSSKIGIFDTAELESDSFVPDAATHIAVTGGGSSGLVLDESRNQLYVMTRFDNAISILDTSSKTETNHIALHNSEPAAIVDGRPFLYDATFTSSNGEVSCASCHIDANLDSLAWDLGDPEGVILSNPNPQGPLPGPAAYHPMKGPMTTQSLRGMNNHGPLHWRGDRTAGHSGGDPFDETGNFEEFNVAFVGLLGRGSELLQSEMAAFANFIIEIKYPPNPNRKLDNSLTIMQQAGSDFFFNEMSLGDLACNDCHMIDPVAGLFGSSGLMSFEAETQEFKIPHLRNMYQKVGMFGMPFTDTTLFPGDGIHMGDQIRGFGFIHDGSVDTLFRFHSTPFFDFTNGDHAEVEQFMHAMDNDIAPIVGQQVTITQKNLGTTLPRAQLLFAQMDAGDNEVIVKGNVAGKQWGAIRNTDGTFQTDNLLDALLSEDELIQIIQNDGSILTFTAVPIDTSVRMGIDRDSDSYLDANDNCPAVQNNQLDSDGDGLGDACDN